MKVTTVCAAAISLLLAGCGHTFGELGPTAYEQSVYGYKVAYHDPADKSFVEGDWALDNFFLDGRGNWKAKEGDDYEATREFDENGDGRVSREETYTESIYDLRLVNRRDDGVIWVKAHPLLPGDAHRDLEVVLNDYADGLSGAGLYAQSNLFSVERPRERHFTTFVTSREVVKVGELLGLASTVELAEVEKLRLDPSFRSAKIRIVLVKFYFYEDANNFTTYPWPTVKHEGKSCFKRPGLLIAGYYNTTDRFADHLPEFGDILGRIAFSSGSLMDDEDPPSVTPDAKPADAGAAQSVATPDSR